MGGWEQDKVGVLLSLCTKGEGWGGGLVGGSARLGVPRVTAPPKVGGEGLGGLKGTAEGANGFLHQGDGIGRCARLG